MFWNQRCIILSQKLGIDNSNVDISNKYKRRIPKKYDFHFYRGIVSGQFQYRPIPIINNTAKKNRLRKNLRAKENKRYKIELKKNKKLKTKRKPKAFLEKKHEGFLKDNKRKVKELDMFIRTRIVKLSPKDHQKRTLLEWITSCDKIYNDLVLEFNSFRNDIQNEYPDLGIVEIVELIKKNEIFPINHRELRNQFIHEYTKIFPDTPFCIISNTVKEFVASLKSNMTKVLKRQIDKFEMGERDLNRPKRTINIDHKYLKKNGPYPTFLGKLAIQNNREKKFKWSMVTKDFKIVYQKFEGNFYLHAPILVEKKPVPAPRKQVVAIDPGENKFVTGYCPQNYFYIGTKIRDRIRKRLKAIDTLKSKIRQKPRRKWKYRKAIHRHYKKMHNDRDELHYKLNLFLVRSYERILIPEFSSKKVSKKELGLNPLTKQVFGQMSHYKMRQRLKNKCEEYTSQYIIADESYTTQTCGHCGFVDKTAIDPVTRMYKCTICGLEIDRDLNGARAILIKNGELVFR